MHDMEMTLFETVQIEIPGILKGHSGNAEGVSAGSFKKKIPTTETRSWFLSARVLFAAGPELGLKMASFEHRLPRWFRFAAGCLRAVTGPGL